MTWLLILLGLALVISPLMWFRQSPHQQQITELRRLANSLLLQVKLHRRPDARDDEVRLETVCYRLPWTDTDCRQSWVLQRYSDRGWQSHCCGWHWYVDQANAVLDDTLSRITADMPESVTAVVANDEGIGVIWTERGDSEDVQKICQLLMLLRQKAEEIWL
ncbi:MAG: hypothetical protein ACPH3I_06835 [Porticoccaceae bacterium]